MRIKPTPAKRAQRRRAWSAIALLVSATLGAGVVVAGYGMDRPVVGGIGFLMILPILVLGWSVLRAARPRDRVPAATARIKDE